MFSELAHVIAGKFIHTRDELLKLHTFNPPLVAAADLNGGEFPAPDQPIGLCLADVQLLSYIMEFHEAGLRGCHVVHFAKLALR